MKPLWWLPLAIAFLLGGLVIGFAVGWMGIAMRAMK